MKTILITGTTSGIGKETVEAIARIYSPVRFLLGNRDETKTEAIIDDLKIKFPNAQFQFERLDLSSLDSIRKFSDDIISGPHSIDSLVLNAGLQVTDGIKKTVDGFEMTFGVNHLGHFLLTRNLLIKMNEKARVVIVSSGTHDPAQRTGIPVPRYSSALQLSKGELAGPDNLSQQDYGKSLYSTSKLCNLMFGYELAERLKSSGNSKLSGLQVLIFDPKMTPGTGLARTYPAPIRLIWNLILPLIANRMHGARSVDKTAEILAWLSASDEAKGQGLYFDTKVARKSSDESYDRTKWTDLWKTSCMLCGLPENLD